MTWLTTCVKITFFLFLTLRNSNGAVHHYIPLDLSKLKAVPNSALYESPKEYNDQFKELNLPETDPFNFDTEDFFDSNQRSQPFPYGQEEYQYIFNQDSNKQQNHNHQSGKGNTHQNSQSPQRNREQVHEYVTNTVQTNHPNQKLQNFNGDSYNQQSPHSQQQGEFQQHQIDPNKATNHDPNKPSHSNSGGHVQMFFKPHYQMNTFSANEYYYENHKINRPNNVKNANNKNPKINQHNENSNKEQRYHIDEFSYHPHTPAPIHSQKPLSNYQHTPVPNNGYGNKQNKPNTLPHHGSGNRHHSKQTQASKKANGSSHSAQQGYSIDQHNQNIGYGNSYNTENQGYGIGFHTQTQGYGNNHLTQNQGYGNSHHTPSQGYGNSYQIQNQGYGNSYQAQNQGYGNSHHTSSQGYGNNQHHYDPGAQYVNKHQSHNSEEYTYENNQPNYNSGSYHKNGYGHSPHHHSPNSGIGHTNHYEDQSHTQGYDNNYDQNHGYNKAPIDCSKYCAAHGHGANLQYNKPYGHGSYNNQNQNHYNPDHDHDDENDSDQYEESPHDDEAENDERNHKSHAKGYSVGNNANGRKPIQKGKGRKMSYGKRSSQNSRPVSGIPNKHSQKPFVSHSESKSMSKSGNNSPHRNQAQLNQGMNAHKPGNNPVPFTYQQRKINPLKTHKLTATVNNSRSGNKPVVHEIYMSDPLIKDNDKFVNSFYKKN